MKVVIVDYGMGNLTSVATAFSTLGVCPEISGQRQAVREADRLVLPGVGAYGNGIHNLRACGLDDVLKEQVLGRKKPFLGICLGMQLLSSVGFEFGSHEGLGWISGQTVRLEPGSLRLPHIGWNDVVLPRVSQLMKGVPTGTDFYFVHSFTFCPDDPSVAAAFCDYGGNFLAAVEKENIYGVQFHPEKSGDYGLRVLQNFLEARC